MEAVGAASAIIGVAQFGIQFSQVLITVIGDYRDAAKNINRLRDEIHLASICLQQLGDLASRDLLREYGIIEATNLRERCQAVFWEIRSKIRKGDSPQYSNIISKDQIDVTYFTSVRWALWTKKQLEDPRQELDRLKDSMTLCFVSHMAILAASDLERAKYASQIPGIKRSLTWSEKLPDDNLFRRRLERAGIPPEKIAEILGDDDNDTDITEPNEQDSGPEMTTTVVPPRQDSEQRLKAWSINLLGSTQEMPVVQDWIARYLKQNDIGDSKLWKVHGKLHPWFKNELDTIFRKLATDEASTWTLVFLNSVYKGFITRGLPTCVQVVMKASPKASTSSEYKTSTMIPEPVAYSLEEPIEAMLYQSNPTESGDTTSNRIGVPQTVYVQVEPRVVAREETDEEIIARQLALYE